MIKIYSPNNEIELSFIKSIFDAEEVPYFVHNDHYGSLKIGPRVDLLNAKTIYVHEDFADKAKDLIRNYLDNTAPDPQETEGNQSNYSLADKIRMVIETLIFGWIMPGKRWNKKHKKEA